MGKALFLLMLELFAVDVLPCEMIFRFLGFLLVFKVLVVLCKIKEFVLFLELVTDFHCHLRSLVEAIFEPDTVDNVGNIDKFFRGINLFLQMVLDNFEKLMKYFDTVGDVLADNIPVVNKFFVL